MRQKNIKRFLAYSSISHFGLICLSLIQQNSISGLNASVIYLNTYVLMSVFFWSLLLISSYIKIIKNKRIYFNITTISELKHITQTNPGLAFALCINLLSMGGLPPFSGFIAKSSVFFTLVESLLYEKSNMNTLLITIAIFASLTSVYYYLKITKNLFFTSKNKTNTNVLFVFKVNSLNSFVLGAITVFNITGLFFFF
jgi:NADH-quinone oxidoreductase subunit N